MAHKGHVLTLLSSSAHRWSFFGRLLMCLGLGDCSRLVQNYNFGNGREQNFAKEFPDCADSPRQSQACPRSALGWIVVPPCGRADKEGV